MCRCYFCNDYTAALLMPGCEISVKSVLRRLCVGHIPCGPGGRVLLCGISLLLVRVAGEAVGGGSSHCDRGEPGVNVFLLSMEPHQTNRAGSSSVPVCKCLAPGDLVHSS
ncbi:hypothetical protein AVEN_264153-1 [Araneus ventricosus]|uniref:Uncharacterized protein n=1 Tax=Araneus ventricosus TaxID=182803 RepID=A0A4Y2KHN9_ARAVE|nr:hypothetical protein AVEN_264153-1 [Araneus ventricosus]